VITASKSIKGLRFQWHNYERELIATSKLNRWGEEVIDRLEAAEARIEDLEKLNREDMETIMAAETKLKAAEDKYEEAKKFWDQERQAHIRMNALR